MIFTSHVLTGAVLATTTGSPFLAFLFGLCSHFVLDLIPHLDPAHFSKNDEDSKKLVPYKWFYALNFLDIAISLTFIWLIRTNPHFAVFLWGILGAIVIDLTDNNPLFQCWMDKTFFKQVRWIHNKLHWHFKRIKWYWCLIFEMIILVGTVWYLVVHL